MSGEAQRPVGRILWSGSSDLYDRLIDLPDRLIERGFFPTAARSRVRRPKPAGFVRWDSPWVLAAGRWGRWYIADDGMTGLHLGPEVRR